MAPERIALQQGSGGVERRPVEDGQARQKQDGDDGGRDDGGVQCRWVAGDREIDGYPPALYAAIVTAALVTVLLLPGLAIFDGAAFDAAAALL